MYIFIKSDKLLVVQNQTKKELRERILTLLRNQKEEERVKKSLVISHKLFAMPEFQKSSGVLFYASFDGEVHTFEMMQQTQKLGKTIGLPTMIRDGRKIIPRIVGSLENDLSEGPYGVKQPKKTGTKSLNLDEIDLAIIPGVAFDKYNNRLGRGLGYYDRFLKRLPSHVPTIGLAFDFQIVDRLPQKEKHDIPVSYVLSNPVACSHEPSRIVKN